MYLFLSLTVLLMLSAAYTAWRVHQISGRLEPDGSLARIDGVNLHYRFVPAPDADPEAPVLVFLHGASGNSYDTRMAFEGAFDGRYPLLFIDRPGLGFSERDFERHSSLKGQAALIDELLEHLDIDRAIVVGHSFGGAVTAVLGLIAPDRIAGLAFIAPVSHPWPGGVDLYYRIAAMPVVGEVFTRTVTLPMAERLAPAAILRVFEPGEAPEDYADAIRLPLLFRPNSFRANSMDIASLKEEVIQHSASYGELTQPTVIITGTEDSVVWPSIHSEGLLRDLPNAELILLEGAGHMPHHTHKPDVVAALEKLVERVRVPSKRYEAGRKAASGHGS